MLGALKFIPRDEVERPAGEKEGSRGRAKKRKHKDREKTKSKSKSRDRKKRTRSSDSDGSGDSSGSASDESDREPEASALELKEDAKARRKEAGLGWMLNAPDRPLGVAAPSDATQDKITLDSEKPKLSARELNPYLGAEESIEQPATRRPPVPMVGDGGASWRLKALKRAQEQAAREGGRLDEIVEERWGSLGNLTSSVATSRSAHANAHLHAIRDRRRSEGDAEDRGTGKRDPELSSASDRRDDHHHHQNRGPNSQMRVPRPDSSLSWKKKQFENRPMREADAAIVRAAAGTFNKYAGDGSFLKSFESEGRAAASRSSVTEKPSLDTPAGQASTSEDLEIVYEPTSPFKKLAEDLEKSDSSGGDDEDASRVRPQAEPAAAVAQRVPDGGGTSGLSANQVAAKAMRLRMAGKAKEADELLREFETSSKDGPPPQRPASQANVGGAPLSANQVAAKAMRLRLSGKAKEADELLREFESSSKERPPPQRPPKQDDMGGPPSQAERPRQMSGQGLSGSSAQARDKYNAQNRSYDSEMAGGIARNKSYKGNVDDEYEDFGNGMEAEVVNEKKGSKKKITERASQQRRRESFRPLTTQQEQCQFCFENPRRPKHLVIAIANFSYLMLPPGPSMVPFHCYIVAMQHDSGTRNVDGNVWQELRNFKKCLIQMLGDQGMEALFIETSMRSPKKRRHCYIECIPVPPDVAKDAPLYFKKAIDEAEDEWSQHDAKKLIDTRQKGLLNSIPKNFSYFHVEFGIQGGYAHVIDDESSFKLQFGRDVIAGMLELPEEGHHVRHDSIEQQRIKVKEFLKLWQPFDWTKMLE